MLRRQWDVILALGWLAVLVVVWYLEPSRKLADPNLKSLVYTSIKEAVGAGITAASIFIPIIVAILTLLVQRGRTAGTADYWRAILWFSGSVLLGGFNLFRLPTMILWDVNLAYESFTGMLGGMQACTFVLGLARFIAGTSSARQTIPGPGSPGDGSIG